MPEVNEADVYNALLEVKGEAKLRIGKAEITLSLIPEDVHRVDRPDSILWVKISLRIFGQNLTTVIPIPVEAEKHGKDAQEDLDEFIKRKHYPIEVPMPVVAEAGYRKREVPPKQFATNFTVVQVPLRRLLEE